MNKLKNYKSNIFFLENEDNNKMDTYNKKITSQNRKDLYSKFRDSDIFNLRKDKNIINKS